MENLMVRIHNIENDEITDREMNKKELEEYTNNQNLLITNKEKEKSALAAKQSAQAKLAALGLTEEEVAAIVGN